MADFRKPEAYKSLNSSSVKSVRSVEERVALFQENRLKTNERKLFEQRNDNAEDEVCDALDYIKMRENEGNIYYKASNYLTNFLKNLSLR